MRLLKNKIAMKLQASQPQPAGCPDLQIKPKLEVKQEYEVSTANESSEKSSCSSPKTKKSNNNNNTTAMTPSSKRGPRKTKTPADGDSKNIIKNYGKALCTFASSKMAVPYIESLMKKVGLQNFNIKKFMEHMRLKKEPTNSMENIRCLLIEEDGDTEEAKAFKKVFKELSIIFMKFFAVNWIYSGKIVQKTVHLRFRFKMLRRIKNPEFFTYLKTSPKNL